MMRSLGTWADMIVCADDIFSLGIHREKTSCKSSETDCLHECMCVDYNEELMNIFFPNTNIYTIIVFHLLSHISVYISVSSHKVSC